jgi:hypothetical protein
MIRAFRHSQTARLTRLFVGEILDLGFLDAAAGEAARRVLIGTLAGVLAFGLLLTRVYLGKYGALTGRDSPMPYQIAVAGDDLFTIAAPMLVVAFVSVIACRSIFPDTRDVRVLIPLPVPKRSIFAARLAAVTLLAGLFVFSVQAALMPVAVMMAAGRWSAQPAIVRILAWLAASTLGAASALLFVTAINGGLTAALPPSRLQTAMTGIRSGLLAGLVVCVPLAGLLPAVGRAVVEESTIMMLAPPAWFLGVQRVLLGERSPYVLQLAGVAVLFFSVSLAAAVVCTVVLYARFERLLMPPSVAARDRWGGLRWLASRNPAHTAVNLFTSVILRRNPLHQSVVIGIAASGIAVAVFRIATDLPDLSVFTVIWIPFMLIVAFGVAIRTALVLPVDLGANWLFRLTEHDATRAHQLRSVEVTILALGVLVPIALTLPLQWAVIGPRALFSEAVAAAWGFAFAQLLLSGWRRIPFTCSYLPGKRIVAHTALTAFVVFVVFTTSGSLLSRLALRSPIAALSVAAVVTGLALEIRRRRVQSWRVTPLAFQDQPLDQPMPIRLSAD